MTKPTMRLSELDAVRGWAALSVVVFHVFWETFGVAEPVFRNLLTAPLINGSADVAIFFILSGDVLVYNFLATGNSAGIQTIALKRYLRLTLPILAACAVTWAILKLNLARWDEASAVVHRGDWFHVPPASDVTLGSLLSYALWDVYSLKPDAPYIAFLWTMRIELFGSAAVILYALVQQRIAYKKTVLAGIAGCLYISGSYFAAFFVGALIPQARAEGLLAKDFRLRFAGSIGLLAAGLFLSGWAMRGFHWTPRPSTTIGILIVAGIVGNRPLCVFLARNRVSQFLGHVSFPLYLMHLAVIIGPMSWAIIWADRRGFDTTLDRMGIALASIALCIVCAWCFFRWSERLPSSTGSSWRPPQAVSAALLASTGRYRRRLAVMGARLVWSGSAPCAESRFVWQRDRWAGSRVISLRGRVGANPLIPCLLGCSMTSRQSKHEE